MIPEPHGGRLVDRLRSDTERHRREAEQKDLLTITPFIDEIYDAEKIGVGAYSPLEGFQDQATLESIVTTNRLPDGLPWTIPIVLAPSGKENLAIIDQVKSGDEIGLLDSAGKLFALLHLSEKFPYDEKRVAQGVFATTDSRHPNVGDLLTVGDTALAGKIDLLRRLDLPTGRLELTPSETRTEFARRGWSLHRRVSNSERAAYGSRISPAMHPRTRGCGRTPRPPGAGPAQEGRLQAGGDPGSVRGARSELLSGPTG